MRAGRAPRTRPSRRVVGVDQLDVVAARREQLDDPVGVAVAQRLGQRADRSPKRWDVRSAATGDRRAPPRPSTRSASTAPASTEASWSGSPTSTSRVSGRTASRSRAIIVSDTIEVSSTTTTSWGSRLSRSCRNRTLLSGRQPSSRCSVDGPEVAEPLAVGRRESRRRSRPATASCSRAAALPVGAVSAIRSGRRRRRSACSASSASRPATVVVLPVPGPPVSTVVHCAGGVPGGSALLVVPRPGKTRAERRPARPPSSTSGGRPAEPGDEVVADLLLLAPVAVEVEQAARRAGAPAAPTSGLAATAASQAVGIGPRQLDLGLVLERQRRRRSAGRGRPSPADGADRERHGEQRPLVGLARRSHRAAARRGRRRRRARSAWLKIASRPGAASASRRSSSRVVELMRPVRATPSSRSESSTTIAAGGCQRNTPHGGRRPRGSRARTCRARRGRGCRRGGAPGRSRAAASAGSGAARRSRAAPAAGSASAASPRSSARGV